MRCMLFDLDGTLIDTAPDLAHALNLTRADIGLPAVSAKRLRPFASAGARGLLAQGMNLQPEDPDFEPTRERFLAHYRDNLARTSAPFEGIPELLAALENGGWLWGVVTNKPGWLTKPLLTALNLDGRAACVVSGDCTDTPKPHPAPLHLACEQMDLPATDCIYVGDDERDIAAGKAAGMYTVAVRWGYAGTLVDAWGADLNVVRTEELEALIKSPPARPRAAAQAAS